MKLLRSSPLLLLALTAGAFLRATPGAWAKKATLAPSLPKALQEIEKKYSAAQSISARFLQVDFNQALGQKKTSSGKVFVKRPGKIRWETEKPEANLFVSDGKTFWFYTPPFDEGEAGQLIEKKSSEIQSRLANALLSGDFSRVSGLRLKQNSENLFTVIPKKGTAGSVQKASLWIDPKQHLIQRVALEHQGGNHSEITLSEIELGKPLSDELFHFKAPPNTDRVR